jgi:CRP-like cAMP-binding protein
MVQLTVETFTRRFPGFSALESHEMETLIGLLKVQEYEASEALIDEGTRTDSLFFVWDGELDVLMNAPDGEHKVALVGEGSLLGEISILDPGPATATVRSEQGCTALHLDRASLETFWEANPHAASVFMRELSRLAAKRIRAADKLLNELLIQADSSTEALVAVHGKLFKEGTTS